MRNIHKVLDNVSKYLEIIITIAVIIAIIISLKSLFYGLIELYHHVDQPEAFLDFLAIAINIVIGIEFLKMIFNYTVDSVIEVLLFAIARQLIVAHTTIYENCIGIISIAILFAIRKYFFIPKLDKDKKAE